MLVKTQKCRIWIGTIYVTFSAFRARAALSARRGSLWKELNEEEGLWQVMPAAAGSVYASDYTPVTDARLANPEPANWLMTRGNYKGWSYSALDQINTGNVKNLVPVWSFSTGVDSGHESAPIVEQRGDVRLDAVQPGAGARFQSSTFASQATLPVFASSATSMASSAGK
jgi:hypothetical protein